MDEANDDVLDTAHSDAAVVTFSQWRVADPDRQAVTMHAALDAWRDFAWPDGLLSHSCLAAEDGIGLRHHAQWRTAAASEQATATSGERFAAIRTASATDIERHDLVVCQRPITFRPSAPTDPTGCVVIVDIHLRQPDETVQRGWIATVLDALAHQPPSGLIAAHFHPSTDRSRIVNLAEWTSAQAYGDALDDGVTGGINRDGERRWQLVRNHPGIADLSQYARYPTWRTLAVPRPSA